jgi:sarcosine oxidase, subunit gamma
VPEGGRRRAALAGPARADSRAVRLAERPHTGKLNLRGDAHDRAFMAAVGRALGMVLPTDPNTAIAAGGVAALWLGPDEWLLTCQPGSERNLAAGLRDALAGVHAAVTDVTDARTVIRIEGPAARDALAKGCPLDLHPRAFPAGAVAQTRLAKADVLLHRVDDGGDDAVPGFDLCVARSFAGYLWAWLEEACR